MSEIYGSNKLNTPAFEKMVQNWIEEGTNETTVYLQMELAAQGKSVNDPEWEIKEDVPNHPGCRLVYGKKDGKLFSYAQQDDLQDIIDLCEEMRMNFKPNKLGIIKWKMPWIIEQELLARGFPLREMQQNADHKDLDRVFEHEYPKFKCVPFPITKEPPMQLFSHKGNGSLKRAGK